MYLIIGVTGQLGQELYARYPGAIGLRHSHIAVEDPLIIEAITEMQPKVIFNCSAYHVPSDCEIYPEKAYQINCLGPRNLAIAAKKVGAKLVHFSTDYVFDGNLGTEYAESDVPNPINTYGITKLAGEHFIRSHCDNYIIARVSALFGRYKCKAKKFNFPQMMINNAKNGVLNVVDDQFITPTYTYNLVQQIDLMLKEDLRGVYHTTNETTVSWFEFTKMIMKTIGMVVDIVPTKTTEGNVNRPINSSLDNGVLKVLRLNAMWDLQKSLGHYLNGLHETICDVTG